ncbi:hypothetical protein BKA56DRAFT_98372 [Ilyonectria sp. MPI-CAGE-AT-0026]|nr:hypothetical protein BKA56DRAFT_98372 [Ilyonectria sp. MPI-CAGE-AT-0026]
MGPRPLDEDPVDYLYLPRMRYAAYVLHWDKALGGKRRVRRPVHPRWFSLSSDKTLLSGSAIGESLFSYPGSGAFFLPMFGKRDSTVPSSTCLIIDWHGRHPDSKLGANTSSTTYGTCSGLLSCSLLRTPGLPCRP